MKNSFMPIWGLFVQKMCEKMHFQTLKMGVISRGHTANHATNVYYYYLTRHSLAVYKL